MMSEELKPCECGYGEEFIEELGPGHAECALRVMCFNCERATDWFYASTPEEVVGAMDAVIAAWNAGERDG